MDITDRSFTLSLSSRQVKKRSYDEVTAKMQQIEEQHPDKAEFLSIGTTPEGRDIRVLRLSNDIKSDTSHKPGILCLPEPFQGTDAQTTLEYAQRLLDGQDSKSRELLDSHEVWIAPITNPDSYEFNRSDEPFWRKNRRPLDQGRSADTSAFGHDLNSNYGLDDFSAVQTETAPVNPVMDFALQRKNIHNLVTLYEPLPPV